MRRILWLFILFLTLWTGAAIITHAVQCPLPKPWDSSMIGCLNQVCWLLLYGRSLAEKLNSGSTLSYLRKHKHIHRYCHYPSASGDIMGRSNRARSEEGHLFSLCHTDSVRQILIWRSRFWAKGLSRVCIASALELASLKEYFDNADKPCAWESYMFIALTNDEENQGSMLILQSGDSMIFLRCT